MNRISQRILQFALLCLLLSSYCPAQSDTGPAVQERTDLQPIFFRNHVDGAFLLYDVAADQYITYRADQCRRGTLPGSTFKIVNTLIGLETGHLTSSETAIAWDGIKRNVPGWNQPHTLESAFKGSVVPYYQELARRIGMKDMRTFLKKIDYGQMTFDRTTLDDFWLTGDSKVSLFDQVHFLKSVLTGQAPFSPQNRSILQYLMRADATDTYKLFAKSGWVGFGRDEGLPAPEDRTDYGWYVGYVERADGKQYIFATRLEAPAPVPNGWVEARKTVTLACLKKLGII